MLTYHSTKIHEANRNIGLAKKFIKFFHKMLHKNPSELGFSTQQCWRQVEKVTAENEMIGWHHQLDGREFEQVLGVGDGQGSLMCCSPWGHKERRDSIIIISPSWISPAILYLLINSDSHSEQNHIPLKPHVTERLNWTELNSIKWHYRSVCVCVYVCVCVCVCMCARPHTWLYNPTLLVWVCSPVSDIPRAFLLDCLL